MAARVAAISNASVPGPAAVRTDWQRVAALLQASRALDEIEETRLLPERKVLYQFSARGHDLAQILLGLQLTDPHDAASGLLPLAAADAGAGRESGGCRRRAAGAHRLLQRRPRHRRGVQPPGRGGPSVLPACRRRRRAVHAGGRLGPGDPLPPRDARRTRLTRAASPWCSAGMPPPPPTASGRRSTSPRPCSCRCCSTSRTTRSASRCPRSCRPRAATSRRTSPPSPGSPSWKATAPTRRPRTG